MADLYIYSIFNHLNIFIDHYRKYHMTNDLHVTIRFNLFKKTRLIFVVEYFSYGCKVGNDTVLSITFVVDYVRKKGQRGSLWLERGSYCYTAMPRTLCSTHLSKGHYVNIIHMVWFTCEISPSVQRGFLHHIVVSNQFDDIQHRRHRKYLKNTAIQ